MRVSERMRYDIVSDRVETAKDQNASVMTRLSSQKDINELSDDPIGAAQAIRYRERIGSINQWQKNVDYSKGYLERSESAIEGISNNLIRAKELAIAMANDTNDSSAREATSREIREILDEVIALGNSRFNSKSIFGGFRTQTPALGGNGDYLGDDGSIYLQIAPGQFRQINLQARELFEPRPEDRAKGHFGMVETLDVLYSGLVANDKTAIQTAISELDYQLDKATSSQATIGAMWSSLEKAGERLSKENVLTRESLSNTEDADIYEATSEFKRTETALQSTLMASTKLLQPSLMNYLK